MYHTGAFVKAKKYVEPTSSETGNVIKKGKILQILRVYNNGFFNVIYYAAFIGISGWFVLNSENFQEVKKI